jgi:secondary thiamine-phosphate synthase enzyme
MVEFRVKTSARIEMVDVTAQVNEAIASTKCDDGLCNIFIPHTTASVIVSENWDPDVTTDILAQLQKVVPHEAGYQHSEGNSQAHILSVMLSTSINIPVRSGKLALGKWQGVMLVEFDGPRERGVIVSVIEAAARTKSRRR